MKFRFFKGNANQGVLKDIYDEWVALRNERDEKLKAIFKEIPFYNSWYGSETHIQGIVCFSSNTALEDVKNEKGYRISSLNSEQYLVKPDRRFKKGKELSKQLEKITKILRSPASFSDFSLRKLSLNIWVFEGTTLYISVTGLFDDVFIAKIPVDEQKEFPEIPEFLTEIKESEFLAIQGL